MNYILCALLMGCIAFTLFYLGRKISYSYNLYNPSITLGFGIIFFLIKMIFSEQNTIGYSIDVMITTILFFIWMIAVIEAVIIDIFETGDQILKDVRLLREKIKLKEIKIVVTSLLHNWKRTFVRNKKTT